MYKQEYSAPNDKTTEMNTMAACINKATIQGFVDSFKISHRQLFAPSNGRYYNPDEVQIINFYRFEGESDPSENAIMYTIETKDGTKGSLIDAYGVYSDDKISKFISEVENINKKIQSSADSIKTIESEEFKYSKDAFMAKLVEPPIRSNYKGANKMENYVAIITGGDSGIGRSVAVHFAREGADIAIVYNQSDEDAMKTKEMIEKEGKECLLFKGDVSSESFCKQVCDETNAHYGKITTLVNNAGMHIEQDEIGDISQNQLKRIFEVNIFPFFQMAEYALQYMEEGSTIINTTSVTAYRGSEHLIDYAATKGAIVSLTTSLAKNLAEKNIRVNAVAPGPIWTPLVINSFDAGHLSKFGDNTPMKRAGYPYEVAPAYVYLASKDSSYMTGQVLHVNGGEIVD